MIKNLLIVSAFALTLTGCGVVKALPSGSENKPAPPPTNKVATAQLSGQWVVEEVAGQQVTSNSDEFPYITFNPSKKEKGAIDIVAFNGCNYLNGSWLVKNDIITPIGEMISTMKACADNKYEQAINNALNDARLFTVKATGLGKDVTLCNADGQPVMQLRKHDLGFLDGRWEVLQINGAAVDKEANLEVVLDSQQGTIHGNAGCNVVNGSMICTLEKDNGLEFRDLRTTRMTCPYISTEQAFLLALEEVTSVQKTQSGDIEFKNDKGHPIILMKRYDQR